MATLTSLNDLHHSAKINRGKCLSKEYIDAFTPVEWQCERGHRFALVHRAVKQGAWCNQCLIDEKKKHKLKELVKLAKIRKGWLVSNHYVNARTKYQWKCSRNHLFKALYINVKNGNWCKKCTAIERREKEFSELKKVIEKKGAICKSTSLDYINNRSKIKITCKNKHSFVARAGHLKLGHSWCPYCSGKAKHTLDHLASYARSKKGKFLSKIYKNSMNLLIWQCEKKHQWKNTANHVLSGQWCPECRKTKLSQLYRTDINMVRQTAIKRGGQLISKNYTNSHCHLTWRCAKGHTWEAKYMSVKAGTWCPICATSKRSNSITKS